MFHLRISAWTGDTLFTWPELSAVRPCAFDHRWTFLFTHLHITSCSLSPSPLVSMHLDCLHRASLLLHRDECSKIECSEKEQMRWVSDTETQRPRDWRRNNPNLIFQPIQRHRTSSFYLHFNRTACRHQTEHLNSGQCHRQRIVSAAAAAVVEIIESYEGDSSQHTLIVVVHCSCFFRSNWNALSCTRHESPEDAACSCAHVSCKVWGQHHIPSTLTTLSCTLLTTAHLRCYELGDIQLKINVRSQKLSPSLSLSLCDWKIASHSLVHFSVLIEYSRFLKSSPAHAREWSNGTW